MKKPLSLIAVFLSSLATLQAGPRPGFGMLFYQGAAVRPVVPPAAMPKSGTDDFYGIVDGVAGQLAVIAVAPGDRAYRGGKWAFHAVTWNVDPYLLTSELEVVEAEASGDVSITRIPEMDFKCPVQP